jgi:hypothetical protein
VPFEAAPLKLTGGERDELRQMSISRSLPAGNVMGARLILMLAYGRSYGSTHWSVRKLAREFNLSKDTVHRIWRAAGIQPHRLERYMASDDPDFETKAADIIGLYLNPP